MVAAGVAGVAVFTRRISGNNNPAGYWVGADEFMAGGHVRFTMGPLPDPYRPGR